ncbi:polycystin cation channel domain-containing protein [Ditylenchus destructor]|nr:polycystin cation channel domain-containing protein [Ditylenchus destructor]
MLTAQNTPVHSFEGQLANGRREVKRKSGYQTIPGNNSDKRLTLQNFIYNGQQDFLDQDITQQRTGLEGASVAPSQPSFISTLDAQSPRSNGPTAEFQSRRLKEHMSAHNHNENNSMRNAAAISSGHNAMNDISDAHVSFSGIQNDIFTNYNEALDQLPQTQRDLGERLRRHLQFFFMNPLEKYRIRRQFPFKLVLQILKVVFITIQLVLFAELRISHVDFLDDTVTVMRHKFLKKWDDERDAVVYPPDTGKYALFTSDEIIEHFSFIVKAYYSLQNDSFASFSYDSTAVHPQTEQYKPLEMFYPHSSIPPVKLCIDRIADVNIQNETYIFDISEVNECFSLNFTKEEVDQISKDPFAIRELFNRRNITFKPEDALIINKASVKINLRTIHFSPLSTDQKPECYLIKITIDFDNTRHTGQVFVRLHSIISYVNLCNGRVLQVGTVGIDTIAIGIIDILVLMLCISSLLLCCRALVKAHYLKNTTCDFFESVFKRRLSVKDQIDFFNLWYVTIVVNDVLIIMGTICKVTIEFRDFDSDLFTLTGILLGLGALLVYIGLLRYLGFFSQYNILVLTLKRSLPSILRFMVCTIILYLGFLIAGWVIIGPYSIKFRTLSQSSEALFSLLNGDDMFATFYTISDSSTTIKVFGTIYIYLFVCLFIYIVLSLFIAIIMDAYEVVKERYNQGLEEERSTLHEFLASSDSPNTDSPEARELYSAERLLQLDDSWLLRNWPEIRDTLRQAWRSNRQRASSSADVLFAYRSFENPASEANDSVNMVAQPRPAAGNNSAL